MFQTEFEFTLPKGYIDADGNLHRHGTMRLSTALDEIAPMRDPRVKVNESYLTIILLSRVITRLGPLRHISPGVVEKFFSADLAYLQDFYNKINERGQTHEEVVCPECQYHFQWEAEPLGG
jgi:hypothetical protein